MFNPQEIAAKMTTLRFYGGAGGIGDDKILLAGRDTRVWFDFGQSFGHISIGAQTIYRETAH